MNAPIRTTARSDPGAKPAHRRSATTPVHRAQSWRGAALRLGLLLALLASPAHAFEGEQRGQEAQEGPLFDSAAMPAAANWVVLQAVGTSAWRPQGESDWREFTPGEVLPPGCEIETGADGEVTLVAGGDQLIVAPSGRLIVPEALPGQDRRLRHERGRIRVHIESRKDRDVRVRTPLLSLGIKGTNFEVDVDSEQNSVVVHDGAVEVKTPDQRDPIELGAGEGLRQAATPGAPVIRFTSPALDTPDSSADGRTRDASPARRDGVDEVETDRRRVSSDPGRARPGPEGASGRSDRRSAPTRHDDTHFGWLDEWASSWAFAAIAAVALVILAIPALGLLQNLRQQWLDRPGAKGRRRRELIRG